MPFLIREDIQRIGFASVGAGAQISDRASFYGAERIVLGNNVRIDDFAILSAGIGGITIGQHVHIACHASLIGSGKIIIGDFCGISARASVYSSNDDYSGDAMTNPTLPREYTNVSHSDVCFGRHVIVGNGSIILPGVTLEEGVAVGALSLVKKNCEAFGIYFGNPARRVKERSRKLLDLERHFLASKIE